MDENTLARFWKKVDKGGPVPEHRPDLGRCWQWIGKRRRHGGHGVMAKLDGTHGAHRAHRLSWHIATGKDAGLFCVCHACDNAACVNPAHLFLGSQADNMRDMNAKGRGVLPPRLSGENNGHSVLTAAIAAEIRMRYASGEKQDRLASEFGVSQSTISRTVLSHTFAISE